MMRTGPSTTPDLHRSRWMIVDIGEGRKEVPDRQRHEADFLLIYRTLGVFSALATYLQHGIVPRDLVLRSGCMPCWR